MKPTKKSRKLKYIALPPPKTDDHVSRDLEDKMQNRALPSMQQGSGNPSASLEQGSDLGAPAAQGYGATRPSPFLECNKPNVEWLIHPAMRAAKRFGPSRTNVAERSLEHNHAREMHSIQEEDLDPSELGDGDRTQTNTPMEEKDAQRGPERLN